MAARSLCSQPGWGGGGSLIMAAKRDRDADELMADASDAPPEMVLSSCTLSLRSCGCCEVTTAVGFAAIQERWTSGTPPLPASCPSNAHARGLRPWNGFAPRGAPTPTGVPPFYLLSPLFFVVCLRPQDHGSSMDIDKKPAAKRRCFLTGEVLMRLPTRHIELGYVAKVPVHV